MGEVEDDIDPWSYINDRYESDGLAQFALILDGIEEAVRLCESGRLSDRRMALITADHLADLILVRHVRDVIQVQETASIFEPRQVFDSKARSLLRQGFNRRVDVATRDLSRRFSLGWGEPILAPVEGKILRVAHAYRNDIYHEDRHNDAALGPVTRAALHAVAQGWLRSQPSRSATSRGLCSCASSWPATCCSQSGLRCSADSSWGSCPGGLDRG